MPNKSNALAPPAAIDDAVSAVGGGSTTQSLDRALALLDVVVANSKTGVSLAPLATAVGLSKPTAHRLLNGLRNAGLIDYNTASRLFAPAFKLYQMGQAIAERFDVMQLAGPSMDRLAAMTEDTVYLSIRSGDQSICVARRLGAFPIKTLTLNVGDSRPLGLGAGNLALLAALPPTECEQVMLRNRTALESNRNHDLASLRGHVERTRVDGFAVNDGFMVPEMAAVGVCVRDPSGRASAALSVAAIKTRMDADRRLTIADQLKREAAEIERLLST